MSHLEFAGRVQTVVEMWREGFLTSSAIERIAALSDEMKLNTQLAASIAKQQVAVLREQARCREIAEEEWREENDWQNADSNRTLGL